MAPAIKPVALPQPNGPTTQGRDMVGGQAANTDRLEGEFAT
jgi:hypothetical protein